LNFPSGTPASVCFFLNWSLFMTLFFTHFTISLTFDMIGFIF
jgi:hypothetical protein